MSKRILSEREKKEIDEMIESGMAISGAFSYFWGMKEAFEKTLKAWEEEIPTFEFGSWLEEQLSYVEEALNYVSEKFNDPKWREAFMFEDSEVEEDEDGI